MEQWTPFCKRLMTYRKAAGLTQRELAQLIGVDQSIISNYEKQKNTPRARRVEEIAAALHVPASKLYGEKGNMVLITLEVERNTPLSIADAIIEMEKERMKEDYSGIIAKEDIRQIGQALVNFAEASDRAAEQLEKIY